MRHERSERRSIDEPRALRVAATLYGLSARARCRARCGARPPRDAARCLPTARCAHDLRGPALRGDVACANGGLSHLLLRVSLPLHHRHRARRVEVDRGRRAHQAAVSSRNGHVPGDVRDRSVRKPRPGLHASGDRSAVRHALRCRKRPGGRSRLLERDSKRRANSGPRPQHRASALRNAPRSLGPAKLQAYRIAPQDVVTAIANAETISPSGNIYSNDKYPVVEVNSIVKGAEELADVPVRPGTLPAVFVRDVARVADGSDILTSVALVNGRPTVYIPVTKRADASTLSVVNIVRQNLPRFQAALPDDVKVSYVFDQSSFVTRAIGGLTTEGILGAILAGLMVLLFLRDWRSALIVVINIPLSLLAATCALWVTGETINIMTLGGLVLAVGILVDESTVVIENIHTHFVTRGEAGLERNVLDAGLEVLGPRLIAMLCVLAVFLPSFAMQGAARALFVPLSLAVGFSLAASYFLGSMLVPILSIWVFRAKHAAGHFAADPGAFDRLRQRYAGAVRRLVSLNWLVLGGYLAACAILIAILAPRMGTDIFPRVEAGQLQVRLRMPAGTRLEVTTAATQRALHLIADAAKPSSIAASVGLVGVHAPSYPINFIYQWNSGPQESVLQVQFTDAKPIDLAALRERLRKRFAKEMPAAEISFEPSDIVSRVMSLGASTPIEVQVSGANLADDRAFATRVRAALARLPMLRDVQFGQPLEYPAVDVTVNRQRAGVLGVTTNDVTQSLSAATASSRFTQPVYWAASSGVAYQVQVEVPQHDLTSLEDLRNVPVTTDDGHSMLLRNIATVHPASIVGEYDRYNMARMVTVTANIEGASLGEAAAAVNDELAKLGTPPKRVSVAMRGEVAPMTELLSALRTGLALAVLVIFLLLVAN